MDILGIDAARKRAGLSILELSRRAGVAPSTFWFCRTGKVKPQPRTLEKYRMALAADLPSRRSKDGEEERMRLAYRGHLGLIALQMGFDPAQVQAEPNARRFWEARCLAIYATAVEGDVRGATLGRALGLSKQVVSWNLKKAEDMRDDPTIDAMVESVGKFIKARGE